MDVQSVVIALISHSSCDAMRVHPHGSRPGSPGPEPILIPTPNPLTRMKTLTFPRVAHQLFLAVAIALGSAIATNAQSMPTPAPEHEAMKKHEGVWLAKIKSNGTESTGTMTLKLDCGGLWMSSEFQADFGGQKFQGRGLDGYDPAKKKYVSVWVDSFSTSLLIMEGTMNKEKKTVTMFGEGPGPDGKPIKFKSETVFTDDDHQAFRMFAVDGDGKDMEILSIDYTRKK